EPLDERQQSVLKAGQHAACLEELASLIDTLENRLGKGRVYRLAPQESYIPERAVKRQAVIPARPKALSGIVKNAQRGPGKAPGYRRSGSGEGWQQLGERPIRLFARPQPIDVTAALTDAPPVLF